MIEVIYNESAEDKSKRTTSLRLPKNIRQIGNTEEDFKIYIEDYVVTFLNQLTEKDLGKIRVAILMGDAVECSGRYVFISGAIYVEDVEVDGNGVHFTDSIWGIIYENIKEYFDSLEIVGWYLSVPGFPIEMNENIKKVHINQFAGNLKILMMHEPIEHEEVFFYYENGDMKPIHGYYIYYEKNNLMQTYMIEHRNENEEEVRVEEKTDAATRQFRSLVQEKQEEIHKRKTMTFMYSVSSVLVMIVLVIGITMLNNYDKMSNMEKSLAILTKNVITEQVSEQEEVQDKAEPKDQSAIEMETLAESQNQETNSMAAGSGTLEAVSVETISGNVEKAKKKSTESGQVSTEIEQKDLKSETAKEAEPTETLEPTQAPEVTETPEPTEIPEPTKVPEPTEIPEPTKAPEPIDTQEPAKESEPADSQESAKAAEPNYYIIAEGDTLAEISLRVYKTKNMVSKICEVNNIEDVDKIFVGQKILLP